MNINDLVDNVYVLNLEKDLYKYNTLKRKLDEKNIVHERFVGVDGYGGDISSKEKVRAFKKLVSEYEDLEIWNRVMYRAAELLSNNSGAFRSHGAMGCLLSHRNLIQDAIDNKYKKILIFQDDIYFHNDFEERLDNLRPVIESSVGVHLGATEYTPNVKNRKWSNPNWNHNRIKYSTHEKTCGMYAVIISEEMFAPFMELSKFKLFAADQTLAMISFAKFFHFTWVAYPNIVIPDMTYSNTFDGVTHRDGEVHRPFNDDGAWLDKFGWDLDYYDLSELYYNG